MKNKTFIYILFSIALASQAAAQHENCDHGDAPDASANYGISNFVRVDKMSMEAINLKTAAAEPRKIDDIVAAIGKIENIPSKVSAVSARIAGRIAELYITPDSYVKKGQPICKIESLLPGNPPPSVVIKAPQSGIVEVLNAFEGSPVEPNAEIARIADTSSLYAVANVFENDIGKLRLGLGARVRLEAFGDKIFRAKLAKFGSKLSPDTSTLPVYFLIENPGGEIKSGMRGIVYISAGEGKPAVSVPKTAIIGGEGQKFVYVENCGEDGIFEKRQVIVGRTDDLNAEILHGLKAGETVATSGVYQLQFMPAADIVADGHANSVNATVNYKDTDHDHSKHAAHEPAEVHLEDGHEGHAHSESEHASAASENTTGGAAAGLPLFERLEKSGYFGYLLWAVLGGSILLNVIFAAAYARKSKK